MTGKIAYFGKNGKVGFEEHELPEVEPGAMLVRVLSSNICGSDVKNWKTGASLGVGGDKTCQGHEFVGRIERLGEGVTKDYAGESVKAGDRVVAAYYITCGECRACKIGRYDQCGNAYIHLGQSPDDFPYFSGTFATHYYIHPRQYFYKVPDTLPDSLAAGANCRFSQIYYGLEHIGITAGETEDPRRTIPRATNDIIWRILVFYIGALGVIMAVIPWNTIGGDDVPSPFVQIFDSVGIHAAAGILNFVCLTAVMSVYNSGLYANSRMLYSLAKQGNAPAYLGKLNAKGVPVTGVLTSAVITAIAVVVVFVWPEFAFNYLMSIATIAGIINWTMIMFTEMKFRKVVAAGGAPEDSELAGLSGQEALDAIHFKLPFAKVTPWVVLAFLALVVVLMCFSTSYRIAVIAGVIWLAILFAAYQLTQAKK